ncbi:hypothetical protein NE236_27275 [Actinoallomurus purpureus]|uniref:hypothetical protein n=1 Tax=Actinoallomurus purpureus TaxID=478114 RepID=UPI0020929D68|nr:hypothetical protein [Actinoallomurus purpureus]MCO6008681.1 hypothetical protein [Actinoallomurus purpureus]
MHDARSLDHYPSGSHRIEARDSWVWIHHRGAWRKGAIHCWYVHGDTWMAWMQHEDPAPDVPWSAWGLYLYDGVTIRRRHAPAAIARIEVPMDGNGRERVTARLRDTGYSVEPHPTSSDQGTLLIC